MRKRLIAAVLLAASSTLWMGCGTDPEAKQGKLELTGSPVPSPFHVGDSSGLWTASRTTVDAQGRSVKEGTYASFQLVSTDSSVVDIANGRFVVGKKAGSAEVHAEDEKSDLESGTVTVTVTAP